MLDRKLYTVKNLTENARRNERKIIRIKKINEILQE